MKDIYNRNHPRRPMKKTVRGVLLRRSIATTRHGWIGTISGNAVRFIPRIGSINGRPSGWWMGIIHRPGEKPVILTEGQQGECYMLANAVQQSIDAIRLQSG